MSKVKFVVFADYHYWKKGFHHDLSGINEIMKCANDSNADFVIHCGDLCHDATQCPELYEAYINNKYNIPAYNCLGNHELEEVASMEDLLKVYNMPSNYYYIDVKGYRFIVLDTNYQENEDGEIIHNSPYSHKCVRGFRISNDEFEWLEKTISDFEGKCIIISHEPFELPEGAAQSNEFRALINRHYGKVLMCINGHYHSNSINVSDNVIWFDVNAVYNLFWAPMDNPCFTEEFKSKGHMVKTGCYSEDPLYAIVTIDGNEITIKGKKSKYLFDVSPEKIGHYVPNILGRYPVPEISDFYHKFD